LTSRLCPGVSAGLPLEAVEWRRSYGRAPKTVTLKARMVDLDATTVLAAQIPSVTSENGGGGRRRSLLDTPALHTLWVEASDVDAYKASAKEEILNWLSGLRKCGVAQDWAVIVVEGAPSVAGGSSSGVGGGSGSGSAAAALLPSTSSSTGGSPVSSSSGSESRKALQMANKLLSRSSVIEKVRADVGAAASAHHQQDGKQTIDRCISLLGKKS